MKINSNKIVSLLMVIMVFTVAFILLINKNKEEKLGDVFNNNFNLETIPGKQLVLKDMNEDYSKYYVIYFGPSNSFDIHVFNYYNNDSEYQSEFKSLTNNIIYYNPDIKMLRVLYTSGIGSYDSVSNNLATILNSSNLRLY